MIGAILKPALVWGTVGMLSWGGYELIKREIGKAVVEHRTGAPSSFVGGKDPVQEVVNLVKAPDPTVEAVKSLFAPRPTQQPATMQYQAQPQRATVVLNLSPGDVYVLDGAGRQITISKILDDYYPDMAQRRDGGRNHENH